MQKGLQTFEDSFDLTTTLAGKKVNVMMWVSA